MAILKKAIKDNVIAGENKYKYDEEKKGIVIDTNETENYCMISVVTRDGVTSIEHNVPVKCKEFPKIGDIVEIKEQFKKFTITGIYDETNFNTNLEGDIFSDIYGGGTNGYVGY